MRRGNYSAGGTSQNDDSQAPRSLCHRLTVPQTPGGGRLGEAGLKESDARLDLYLAHRHELIDYATALTGDRAHGEDVVQEAFLRLRRDAAARPLDEPLGYLRRIVRNLAMDWHRHRRSEGRYIDPGADVSGAVLDQPIPEEALAVKDELRIVMAAIAELPERTRRALEMHRFEGRKLREIGIALGVSTATAHGLVYEGLAYCRHRLAGGKSLSDADVTEKKPATTVSAETGIKSRRQ